ncbi:MAG: DUF4302 domain-containing protein [Cyclobacteriaceae bacterium]|nr:DUF4302 domain-containing protein [Cyclobacteriaceae bacterium HetDA_MAG_MS6]
MRNLPSYVLLCFVLIFGCEQNNDPDLPSVEERVSEAIGDLQNQLTAPANGWRIDYRPTPDGGTFLILMDFSSDGMVRIQSDVPDNDGEFRDQTILYRIDNSQGLELILETYGVFHFLFELSQASFGGEFEFRFNQQQGTNLIFSSKSDGSLGQNTILVFEPAGPNDSDLISDEVVELLGQGSHRSPGLGNLGNHVLYNIYIPSDNTTISLTIDMRSRQAKIHGGSAGQSIEEIAQSVNGVNINTKTTISFLDGGIVFNQPPSFSIGGNNYTLNQIPLENFNKVTTSYCGGNVDSLVQFSSQNVAGIGGLTMTSSLFQTHSVVTASEDFFSHNHVFIFDQDDESLADSIENVFPGAAAFQFYMGVELNNGDALNAAGFVELDDFNNADFYLRGFDFVQTGNLIEFTFNGDDFITNDDAPQSKTDGLVSLTDLIFEGGKVYLIETIGIEDLFEFYNPCNDYKGFMFKR